jgi:hypothetical protein
MEKTIRSRFAAIHPFQIAHEVSNWLGIARRKQACGIAKYPRLSVHRHEARMTPAKRRRIYGLPVGVELGF